MKKILRSAVSLLLITIILVQTVFASPAPQTYELDTAINFASILESGDNSLCTDLPDSFDYALCYRYVSMLWRDAYVFEYMPLPAMSYMRIVYNDEAKHIEALREAERLAESIVHEDMTDRESYAAIQAWFIDNVEYDMHAALNQATYVGDSFSAYGALVNRLAVCDGISAAFAMICRSAGLPCVYVASTEMNHSWNVVLCGGEVRYIDVTFDLTGGTKDRFLLLDEEEFAKEHVWDRDIVNSLVGRIWDERFVSAYILNRIGGLFKGSDKGWELDRKPTRAEAAIMLVRFLGLEGEALAAREYEMPFVDVNPNHAGYIDILYKMGLTKGTSMDTYSPDAEITAGDYMTFMLRALGYNESEGDFSWRTAVEDSLKLRVLQPEEFEKISEKIFDRGMMSYASLAVLRAAEKAANPLLERVCGDVKIP